MTLAELLRKYQGDRTQTEYARLLNVSAPTLSLIYSGQRNPGNDVARGFLRAFPEAALEYTTALAAPEGERVGVA